MRLAVLMELSDCLILNLGDASGNNTIHSMIFFSLLSDGPKYYQQWTTCYVV